MTAFLSRLAHTFYQNLGNQIADTCFVFPNRRAGLLFKHYLTQELTAPLFAPEVLTIDQLFLNSSNLSVADPIDLQFRLYALYTKHYLIPEHKEESFDNFLFWGKMIMSDFNEIDRQQVDAERLLSNLADLKEIDRRFADVPASTSSIQLSSKTFQTCLLPIYKDLHSQLLAENIAYMGMLQRGLIDRLNTDDTVFPDDKRYVFVGFNVLTSVERALMLHLQARGLADFYFDYESPWLTDTENMASLFAESNLQTFPSQYVLPTEETDPPEIHWVRCSSYVAEAEQIAHIVKSQHQVNELGNLGIVLPNEHLLLPVLHALPDTVGEVNITMGLPLSDTPLYSLLQHLSELQIFSIEQEGELLFHYKPIMGILNHPYIANCQTKQLNNLKSAILRNNMVYVPSTLFCSHQLLSQIICSFSDTQHLLQALSDVLHLLVGESTEEADAASLFQSKQEYIYRTLLIINRLLSLLSKYPAIDVQPKTVYRLLMQLMQTTAVSFEGEPLQGMQIMGVLEARGMDFSTVIIPDMNEDTYPGGGYQNSFIPYDIRQKYNLATPERQDAIAAYNFYRLLSHAKKVYLLQSTYDEGHSPDASRYIYQLHYQYNLPLVEDDIPVETTSSSRVTDSAISLQKDERIMEQITHCLCPDVSDKNSRGLSPTALNTYVQCPLHFYLEHICHFKEPKQIEETLQYNKFGTVLHEVMQHLYAPYAKNNNTRTKITPEIIKNLRKQCETEHLVEKFYAKEFLQTDEISRLQGSDYLPIGVLQRYIKKVLDHDSQLATSGTLYYIASEQDVQTEFPLPSGEKVMFHGIVDRVDEYNGKLRIVDYKTGKSHSKFPKWEELFLPKDKDESGHVRQTLVYAMCYSNTYHRQDIYPVVYYVKNNPDNIEQYIAQDAENVVPYADMEKDFCEALCAVLQEILNSDIPIEARPNADVHGICSNCPFSSLCLS